MTTLAKDARTGTYYRLTRDAGLSYYMLCNSAQVRALTKRVVGKDVRLLSPDDRRLVQALALCRDQEHVLAARFMRFTDDSGQRRETRAYVAFPPDYPLREVARPPGYNAGGARKRQGRSAASEEGAGDDGEEEVDDRRDVG